MAESGSRRSPVKALLDQGREGQQVSVEGWVRTRRGSKECTFLEINDGSCLANLQVVVDAQHEQFAIAEQATTGSSVIVTGTLVSSPGKGQRVELQAGSIDLLQAADGDYPIQKKRHSFEYLRSIAHLRVRSNTFGAVARVRSVLFFAVHEFFQQRGFVYLQAPMITASDAEGAGDMFQVTTLEPQSGEAVDWSKDFFGKKVNLTVSGQLEAELFAHAFHDIYTFGPTFRAENSNTSRHAAEFWMCEPEIGFADLDDNRRLAEDFLRFFIQAGLERCPEDLAFFDQRIEQGLLAKLNHILESDFETITYTEAVRLLEASGENFEFPVSWGHDLQSEHERYLTEKKIGRPTFVVDYPKEIKAFYMRLNDDGKTVAAMDLLVPGVGEIVGGSQREERMDHLQARMKEFGVPEDEYWWYLDLRRYGSVPHSGFGIGFERVLMYITGLSNIRDVIPFPRTPGNVAF
ncbi:MAG: asparagine--tRNA ligase [SAR324 cluster bacterium]|nr:asparagine--tRNA ligase [SAR324 cluster bacterium]